MEPSAPKSTPITRWTGDRFLEISFGTRIDGATQRRVHAAARAIGAHRIPGLIDIVPAYASVLLAFELGTLEHDAAAGRVREALADAAQHDAPESTRLVEIPVCYDPAHAPDLIAAAQTLGITPEELASQHASATYTVAFLGFMPGFAYLQGLPPALELPRHPTPRRRVPRGSVAIGGMQTGVYALDSPGGWQIIGSTPLTLFDPSRAEPSLLLMGDQVRFRPISADALRNHQRERGG